MPSRIFANNIANDTAFTVTATTEASTFELENALDSSPKNTWRSTDKANQYFTFNGTSVRQIFGCALFNINTASGDTLQLQTSNNDFAATIDTANFTTVERKVYEMSSGILTETTYTDAYVFQNSNHQDYRIFMNNAAGTYTEIGKIYLFSLDYQFGKDFNYGASFGSENSFISQKGSYGLLTENFKTQRKIWQFQFPGINQAQTDILVNQVGANPFICWIPDGLTNPFYYGKMRVTLPDFIFSNIYGLTCTFEEAL
jgi:hypothetical protein